MSEIAKQQSVRYRTLCSKSDTSGIRMWTFLFGFVHPKINIQHEIPNQILGWKDFKLYFCLNINRATKPKQQLVKIIYL